MNIVVAIATAGRRDILTATVKQLSMQTRPPDKLYICPASPQDLDLACLNAFSAPSEVVSSSRGSSHQRNAIMRRATKADVIVFFDDDFLADKYFLAEIENLFTQHPDIVIATGDVVADGITGPGLSVEDGLAALHNAPSRADIDLAPVYNGYGCNLAVRVEAVLKSSVEFDENLPLYAWLEDIDFSRRLAPWGKIYKSHRLRGVHLGTKSGRTPGKRLGYSQIANPVYLMKKKTVSRRVACRHILRNVAANLLRSGSPEPWVDRRGRLAGNIGAFKDWLRGTISPGNIEKFD